MNVEPASAKTDPVAAQAATTTKVPGKKKFRWRPVLIVLGALLLVFVIIPRAFHAWHTVSTDDAYVNSYVTFVAPRGPPLGLPAQPAESANLNRITVDPRTKW